jgi:transposase, IS5 family
LIGELNCGSGKRKYSLGVIMARLAKGAENSISMAFLVMWAAETLVTE